MKKKSLTPIELPNNWLMKDLNIGKDIRDELKRQGRSVVWYADTIHSDRSNTYKMLKKRSIDLELLMQISELLQHDFLKDCSDKLDFDSQKANKTADSDKKTL